MGTRYKCRHNLRIVIIHLRIFLLCLLVCRSTIYIHNMYVHSWLRLLASFLRERRSCLESGVELPDDKP